MSKHIRARVPRLAPEIKEIKRLVRELISEKTTADIKRGVWSIILEIIDDLITREITEDNERKLCTAYQILRRSATALRHSEIPELIEYMYRLQGVYHLMEVQVSRTAPVGYREEMENPENQKLLGILYVSDAYAGMEPKLLRLVLGVSMRELHTILRRLGGVQIIRTRRIGARVYVSLTRRAKIDVKKMVW